MSILNDSDKKTKFAWSGSGQKNPDKVIGVNQEIFQEMLDNAIFHAKEVRSLYVSGITHLLSILANEWGTQDSVQKVNELMLDIRDGLKSIEKEFGIVIRSIKETAQTTAAKTGNNIVLSGNLNNFLDNISFANKQKPQLENGYIGIMSTLIKDVDDKCVEVKNNIAYQLSLFKEDQVPYAKGALAEESKKYSYKVGKCADALKYAINNKINSICTKVQEYTKNADKLIQADIYEG